MTDITIYGASDDLVEVEGAVAAEKRCPDIAAALSIEAVDHG